MTTRESVPSCMILCILRWGSASCRLPLRRVAGTMRVGARPRRSNPRNTPQWMRSERTAEDDAEQPAHTHLSLDAGGTPAVINATKIRDSDHRHRTRDGGTASPPILWRQGSGAVGSCITCAAAAWRRACHDLMQMRETTKGSKNGGVCDTGTDVMGARPNGFVTGVWHLHLDSSRGIDSGVAPDPKLRPCIPMPGVGQPCRAPRAASRVRWPFPCPPARSMPIRRATRRERVLSSPTTSLEEHESCAFPLSFPG